MPAEDMHANPTLIRNYTCYECNPSLSGPQLPGTSENKGKVSNARY